MILLDVENLAILNVLKRKSILSESGKAETVDAHMTDVDGLRYHVHTSPDDKMKIFIDVNVPFKYSLSGIDLPTQLAEVYGDSWVPVNEGQDFRLLHDISLPDDKKEKSYTKIATFRRHMYGAIVNYMVSKMASGGDTLSMSVREGEVITFKTESDRFVVTYSILFKDLNDIIIGKVFLQEFKEGKRASKNAPAVSIFLNNPPSDLTALNLPSGPGAGHICFALSKNHLNPTNISKTIDCVLNFLPYFKYHVNCSKGYLHCRMRQKTEDFTKILNRARSDGTGADKKAKARSAITT